MHTGVTAHLARMQPSRAGTFHTVSLGVIRQLAGLAQVGDVHAVVGGGVAGVAGVDAIGGGVARYLHVKQGFSGIFQALDSVLRPTPQTPVAASQGRSAQGWWSLKEY